MLKSFNATPSIIFILARDLDSKYSNVCPIKKRGASKVLMITPPMIGIKPSVYWNSILIANPKMNIASKTMNVFHQLSLVSIELLEKINLLLVWMRLLSPSNTMI